MARAGMVRRASIEHGQGNERQRFRNPSPKKKGYQILELFGRRDRDANNYSTQLQISNTDTNIRPGRQRYNLLRGCVT